MTKLFRAPARAPIHEALRLPSPYQVNRSVTGHDTTDGIEGAKYYELKHMRSPTGGSTAVFAVSEAGGPWKEITADEWTALARRILHV